MTTHLPTPPHDLLACSRTALARGSVTRGARARYIEDQRSSFGRPWLRSDGERDGRDKPTTSTKRSGHFPKNPNRHRGVIPKRGYVAQRSGGTHLAKIKSCRASREGALSNFQNPKVPPTGGGPHRAFNIVRGHPHNGRAFFSPNLLC